MNTEEDYDQSIDGRIEKKYQEYVSFGNSIVDLRKNAAKSKSHKAFFKWQKSGDELFNLFEKSVKIDIKKGNHKDSF